VSGQLPYLCIRGYGCVTEIGRNKIRHQQFLLLVSKCILKRGIMNKLINVLIVVLISTAVYGQQKNNTPDSSASYGKVYVFRGADVVALADPFNLYIDSQLVCKLFYMHYSIHQLTPGIHNFSVRFKNIEPGSKADRKTITTPINIEAGKIYYVHITVIKGLIQNTLVCEEITEEVANRFFRQTKEDLECLD